MEELPPGAYPANHLTHPLPPTRQPTRRAQSPIYRPTGPPPSRSTQAHSGKPALGLGGLPRVAYPASHMIHPLCLPGRGLPPPPVGRALSQHSWEVRATLRTHDQHPPVAPVHDMAFVCLLKTFKIFPYKMNFSENYSGHRNICERKIN